MSQPFASFGKSLLNAVAIGVADRIEVRRPADVGTFAEFIREVNPRYQFYPHVLQLIDALERVAAGEIKRLMVFMPPRHGKSELVSRLFPAWFLLKYPAKFVGLNSYAADLAYSLSRNARENFTRAGGVMSGSSSAVKHWETEAGGGMWAAGVGGPITGKGFHVGIIDDPLKNSEEAQSMTIREKQKDWYNSTYSTREEPGGAQIVVLTRWNEDDLAGWLLTEEKENQEGWHIINFEAIKSNEKFKLPETCTLEPDSRDVGSPLCPERYSLAKLNKIKKRSAYFWSALYQQRPSPVEGMLWKAAEIQSFVDPPANLRYIGYDWDLAYTEKDKNSASAFIKAGIDKEKNVYILDAGFKWLEFPALISWMTQLNGPHYIEGKASGKSAKQTLSSNGIVAIEVPVVGGDKIARTTLATPIAGSGKLFVAKHILGLLLNDERQGILRFPNGSHNDLNDALVQAIQRLTLTKQFKVGMI